jgi:predicted nuclease with TOPRIM domain
MPSNYLSLRRIFFSGPGKESAVEFARGVNVICGASDTGKSFLAEAIDFMLGGSDLKEIPERIGYAAINLDLCCTDGSPWRFERAISGGDFALTEGDTQAKIKLRQSHVQARTDNVSGYLLNKIGLLGKRILKSSTKSTTNSLSFRNLARLVIIQEGEIQQKGSPFWGGQYTLKTAELATIKLLLTGVDDSAVISTAIDEPDNARQIALLDELIADLSSDIEDIGYERAELGEQLELINAAVDAQRDSLSLVQKEMAASIATRRELLIEYNRMDARIEEIHELLERFKLLSDHYEVDKQRLAAIQESGSLLVYVDRVPCPLCGAPPDAQHIDEKCDGDVASVVEAATAEIQKIDRLVVDLSATVLDLRQELDGLSTGILDVRDQYREVEQTIGQSISPEVEGAQSQFSELVEKRSAVQNAISMYERLERLDQRRAELDDSHEAPEQIKVAAGIPDAIAHQFSMKVEHILRAWNFPGDCRVHFDKETSDFVIDGKPRGSRGKGLRAITHAAISLALLEFCRERSLPHPGFVVMDSPLLAYFKPEGEDDAELQGTDLKERFYVYLKTHHGRDSQIIIIENQHPPESVEQGLAITVFTRNPAEGRFGLL